MSTLKSQKSKPVKAVVAKKTALAKLPDAAPGKSLSKPAVKAAVNGSAAAKVPQRVAKKATAAAAVKPAAAASKAVPAKTAVKPAKPVKSAKPVKPAKLAKPVKPAKLAKLAKTVAETKKMKSVHASFSMHADEYQVLKDLKSACKQAAMDVRKSEFIRAALMLLKTTDLAAIKQLVTGLPALPAVAKKKR